ncbi:hypothetical protein SALBM217S_09970 [Streptomyces griseoloalbus]
MGVHIDITGLRPERIAAVISPLAELGMALHALSEPAHHPGLQAWVTAVTARLEPHLADRMCEADFLWRTTFSDLFLACAGVPGRAALPGGTLAEELDLLDKLSDEQFVDGALEFTCALPYGEPGLGPLADEGLRRRSLELAASAAGPRRTRSPGWPLRDGLPADDRLVRMRTVPDHLARSQPRRRSSASIDADRRGGARCPCGGLGTVLANESLGTPCRSAVGPPGGASGTPGTCRCGRACADAARGAGCRGGSRLAGPVVAAAARWRAGARRSGSARDHAWTAAVATLERGAAVAVDYAHGAGARPPFGTLTAFREGRETEPVPDGSRDLTAHVALDACAAAPALPGRAPADAAGRPARPGRHGGAPPAVPGEQ